jgi:hypothetical protein
MITKSIKENYCKDLISWGIIKFWGPISVKSLALKKPELPNQKQPIRISDINMIKGFN